jgi:hypothetical protein
MATSAALLGVAGCCGALLMFVSDLILYYPSRAAHRTAAVYFRAIDPHGDSLGASPMGEVSEARLVLGGVLGPIAACLYALGFLSLYRGLRPEAGALGPALAAGGHAAAMAIGAVYHAQFAYTGFIARALAAAHEPDHPPHPALGALLALLAQHRRYMLTVYRSALAPAAVGTLAFVGTLFGRETAYPAGMALLAPALSAPLKLLLRRLDLGDLVLCGRLTNLWNALFLGAAAWSVARAG